MTKSDGGTINVLVSSNQHWRQHVIDLHPSYFTENAQSHQLPALWIGCSDARVPETLITDSPPGRIFMYRTIANQFPVGDISAQSVLEYTVNTLAVENVIVVGHTNCNGIVTAYDNAQSGGPPPTCTPLERWLAPLTQRIIDMNIPVNTPRDEGILLATRENIRMQIENILEQMGPNPIVSFHGCLYHLEQGLIERLPDQNTKV